MRTELYNAFVFGLIAKARSNQQFLRNIRFFENVFNNSCVFLLIGFILSLRCESFLLRKYLEFLNRLFI